MKIIDYFKNRVLYGRNIQYNTYKLIGTLDLKEQKDKDKDKDKKKESKKKDRIRRENLKKSIINKFIALDLHIQEQRQLARLSSTIDDLSQLLSYLLKAKQFKIGNYINFKEFIAILANGRNIEEMFKIAKIFKNTNLDEDEEYADFHKLVALLDVHDLKLYEMTIAMLESKNAGCQIKQKNIVKYFDSHRPASENIIEFCEAKIFAHKNKLDLETKDFINAIINNRASFEFATNYYKIDKYGLIISKQEFIGLMLSQQTITELIDLYIDAREHDIDLNFREILRDYKLNIELKKIIITLLNFKNSGFEITYKQLFHFVQIGGDLTSLYNAYLLNKAYKLNIPNLFEMLTKTIASMNKGEESPPINVSNIVKSINLGKTMFNVSKEDVLKDYRLGADVWGTMYSLQYAKNKNLDIPYGLAKFINKLPGMTVKSAIHDALNQKILHFKDIKVTTKDNIEITVEIDVSVLLNLPNIFNGSGEDVLYNRVKILFIEEIQNKYNHDKIIENIEYISNNILLKLKGEMSEAEANRKNKYPTESHHSGHDSHGDVHDSHAKKHHEEKDEHHSKKDEHAEHKFNKNYYTDKNKDEKQYNFVSKFIPTNIIIPKIDFVKDTFKEIEKAKADFEHHLHHEHAKLEKLQAEIAVTKAWAKSENLKYYILKDKDEDAHGGH